MVQTLLSEEKKSRILISIMGVIYLLHGLSTGYLRDIHLIVFFILILCNLYYFALFLPRIVLLGKFGRAAGIHSFYMEQVLSDKEFLLASISCIIFITLMIWKRLDSFVMSVIVMEFWVSIIVIKTIHNKNKKRHSNIDQRST
jgi:hypothetical protein